MPKDFSRNINKENDSLLIILDKLRNGEAKKIKRELYAKIFKINK